MLFASARTASMRMRNFSPPLLATEGKIQMADKWAKLIPGCFCDGERGFLDHPSEEETAFELLSHLRARFIGWPTLRAEVLRQLRGMPLLNAAVEIEKVRLRFQPWLLD
jgi:hypothetical protein